MDEHMNRTILDNFPNNCENMERKTNPHGVLKSAENGSLQFMSREQEYIDHTLLGPEYISNVISNSFIIDLMEQQDSAGQRNSDSPISSLSNNEAFSSEAQLHTIFQFVNRQGQIRSQTNVSTEGSTDHLIHHTDKEILESELMAMHGNLLNEPNFKLFCSQQSIPTQEALIQDLNVSPLQRLPATAAPLTPIRWLKKESYDEPLEQLPEIVGPLSLPTAKKILPHKKRISRKLKIMDKSEDFYQDNEEIPARNNLVVISNRTQFECEICGSLSESQIQFFTHLKGHYEPSTLEDTKYTPESIPSSAIVVGGDTSVAEETQARQSRVVGDQTFNEVDLNFDSFSAVVGLSTQHQHDSNSAPDRTDMKILGSNVMAKCMEYVAQTQDTAQTCSVHDEVEFSDTEDMLEGIRGVVDKVSVDDTSDDLDMPTTSDPKEPWFANSAFNGLSFKEESINNESFQGVAELVPTRLTRSSGNEERNTPITSMPIDQIHDVFNDNRYDDESSDDFHDSYIKDSNGFSEKRKRGRPIGSTKKKSSSDIKDEDESSKETEDKRRYICTKCNREFNSCNALKYHDLSHTGERPHQCDVCGKSFFAQSALKSHLRVHTGDKPYECDKCDRKFRQWSDLKYHNVSIHLDEKNYQCEFCGKSFSRKYSLVIHRRIHTSERNYKCEFCPKSFRASSYLQNHRKIHTGEKPYECLTCGKKFRVSGDLRRHCKTHERILKTSVESKNSNTSGMDLAKQTAGLKKSKDDLFLDKIANKIDHLFKTEKAFVNTSSANTDLTFVT